MLKPVLISIFLGISFSLTAITNRFSHLTPEDGLSQGNIACFYQDYKGFMWIGTFNGLNRYDGYSIKVFNTDPKDTLSLGNAYVKFICEDNKHNLWLGTYGGGLSVYNPITGYFKSIHNMNLNGKNIELKNSSGLQLGPDGNMWYSEEIQGIFVFDVNLNLIKAYNNNPADPKSLPAGNCNALVFDRDGNCWVGIGNGILGNLNIKTGSFEFFTFDDRKTAVDDGIKSMFIDKRGFVWIGTMSQGAYSFDPKLKEFKNYRKGPTEFDLTSNTVMTFFEGWDGNLMIGTDGGGVNILNAANGTFERIRYEAGNPESLSTDAVYAIFIDLSNTLWIGTYAGGVNYIGHYRYKFKSYKPEPAKQNSLSYKNVKCILQDSDGEIWIGTDGGGLNAFDPVTGSFRHYRADPKNPKWLQTDVIIHMMQDRDGDIYLGSYSHGLTIFNKKTETFKQFLPDENNPNSINGMHPWYFFNDSYGITWIGMLAVGLNQFDKSTGIFKHYRSVASDPTSLNNPNIIVIFEDHSKRLWIGTEGGGLHQYNRQKDNFIRYYNQKNNTKSLSNDNVRAIYEDKKNRLWIGTGMGLDLMNPDSATFKTITVSDGLPGNIISGILEDVEGNLWIATNIGISKFNPDSMTFRNYDMSDGLQGNEFNYTASMIASNGVFYLGGKNGFDVFNPKDIKDNSYIPPVVLTSFQLFNKPLERWKTKINGKTIDCSISELKEIKLSYKENVISFEFAALDFGNPMKNKYKYKLEGFDKDWTETTAKKRYASYSNLSGGNYTFRVIASNGDNIWNNKGLSIKLIVTPPFWKRAWFIILIILIIAFIVFRYIKDKQEKVLRDKKVLEEKISEGLKSVESQKSELLKKDKELELKILSEKEQNWLNTGMSRFSGIISKNKDNVEVLARSIIIEFIDYLEVVQGAIYLYNDDDEKDPYLLLVASYAPDEDRLKGKRIELQEGQIGTCFTERKVIRIDNLPVNYAKLSSGLGDAHLRNLVVVPLKLNEIVIGVVELLSFNPIEDFKIGFIEKVGETLTSLLTALRANEKTNKMLELQKIQAEEFASHEEELRQNLEEMMATKEEADRQAEELRIITEEFAEREKQLSMEIEKLKMENEKLGSKT
jgi:ligand-binding sensor domain-containing protein